MKLKIRTQPTNSLLSIQLPPMFGEIFSFVFVGKLITAWLLPVWGIVMTTKCHIPHL